MKKLIFLAAICVLGNSAFAQTATGDTKIAETKYIEFHSNYLMNLHHFLFNKAMHYSFVRNEEQKNFDSLFVNLKIPANPATKDELMLAVKFYADSLAKKNMLFDEGLTGFKYALEQSNSFDELKKKSKSSAIINAMQKADRLYRDNYWEQQQAANNSFITSWIGTIKKIEEEVITQCSKYYKYTFAGKKFRIDLTEYATFFGAYTTTEPYVSAVISSGDKRHQGTQGIEIIFHEVSHAMIDEVFRAQQKICTDKNIAFDHNVWHSILFYSTGTFVKNALAKEGLEHELYISKNKLASLNPTIKKQIDAITLSWQLYLDGKTDMQTALNAILVQNN